jgi:hypothetical protein
MPDFAFYNPIGWVACIVFWAVFLPFFWFTWAAVLMSAIFGAFEYRVSFVAIPVGIGCLVYPFLSVLWSNEQTTNVISFGLIAAAVISSLCVAAPAMIYVLMSWYGGRAVGAFFLRRKVSNG